MTFQEEGKWGQKCTKAGLVQGTVTILVQPGLNLEKAGCLAGVQAKHKCSDFKLEFGLPQGISN